MLFLLLAIDHADTKRFNLHGLSCRDKIYPMDKQVTGVYVWEGDGESCLHFQSA